MTTVSIWSSIISFYILQKPEQLIKKTSWDIEKKLTALSKRRDEGSACFHEEKATPKLKAVASLSINVVNNRLNHLTSAKLIRKDVKRNILSTVESKLWSLWKFFLLFSYILK